jgi:hypothetical protein
MGINLPARNVFIPEKKWNTQRTGSQIAMMDISKAEHENMGGRAGRLGFIDELAGPFSLPRPRFTRTRFTITTSKAASRNSRPPLMTRISIFIVSISSPPASVHMKKR